MAKQDTAYDASYTVEIFDGADSETAHNFRDFLDAADWARFELRRRPGARADVVTHERGAEPVRVSVANKCSCGRDSVTVSGWCGVSACGTRPVGGAA